MDKLKWCVNQDKGIRLTLPNITLAKAYVERAKSDFKNSKKQNPIWKVIISYYACYNSLYALLSRYGLRCKIHSCTLELMKLFENPEPYYEFIHELKNNRTNTQYYLKEPKQVDSDRISRFLALCELEIEECNQDRINMARKRLSL